MNFTVAKCWKDGVEIYADVFESINCQGKLDEFIPGESTLQVVQTEDKKHTFYILYEETKLCTQLFKLFFREELKDLKGKTFDEDFVRGLIEKMKNLLDQYHLLYKKQDVVTMNNSVIIICENKLFVIDRAFILGCPVDCYDFGSQFTHFVLDLCPGDSVTDKIRWLKTNRTDELNLPYLFANTNDKKGVTVRFRNEERIIPWEAFECHY